MSFNQYGQPVFQNNSSYNQNYAGAYSAYQPREQRLMQYEQQNMLPQPQIQQPVQQQIQNNLNIKEPIPVTSKAQADNYILPFGDNSTYMFINTAENRIYTKRFDPTTGLAPVSEYTEVIAQEPEELQPEEEQFDIKQEFESFKTNVYATLGELKGAIVNVQSNVNNQYDGTAKSATSTNNSTSKSNATAGSKQRRSNKSTNAKSNVSEQPTSSGDVE